VYSRYLLDSSILIGLYENRLPEAYTGIVSDIWKRNAIGFIHVLSVLEYAEYISRKVSLNEFLEKISPLYVIDIDIEDAYNATILYKKIKEMGYILTLSDTLSLYYAKKMRVPIISLKKELIEVAQKISVKTL